MVEIFLYDEFGPDWAGMVSAAYVKRELEKAGGGQAVLRINSPGGSVVEAMGIYTLAVKHGVDVEIDGLAASAASYVAMAGKRIRIAENAMLMIHDPWTLAMGNANELRKTAETLDKFGGQANAVYAARSGMSIEQIAEASKAETWYTASEAVTAGLADEIGTPLNVSACVKQGMFRHTPQQMLAHSNRRDVQRSSRVAEARVALAKLRTRY